jgi:tetratricopeptide (TPR) repeat protein
MRKFIFIWTSILILLSSLSVSSQTVPKDTSQKEILKQQGQIDSLKMQFEKLKEEGYEKAIEGANQSILFSTIVVLAVTLIAVTIGIYQYLRIREMKVDYRETKADFKETITELRRSFEYELGKVEDDFKQEFEKTVNLRREIETKKTEAETLMKDINVIYEDVKKIAKNIEKTDKDIDEKKRSVDESRKEVSGTDYSLRGFSLLMQRKYEEAIENLKKATELSPYHFRSWYNMACAYALQNKKKEALESLKKAIELNSKYKEKAKKDWDFKNLWEDEDFKKLVG